MSELRAPDPTLTGIEPNAVVGLDDGYGDPPLAHVVRWIDREYVPACADPAYGGVATTSANYARWFAVPCPACFPDAPKHGTAFIFDGAICAKVESLSWQVPGGAS